MAQSGMGISVKDYSAMTADTCPNVLASSFLPSPVRSIGTDPVEPVCPSSRSNNPTSIVVQTTGSKHKDTDDPKKGFKKTSDPGLQEWAAAQLPHFETNKEDIEWRTLKHPGFGLILVGIMAGAICWIGRRKYPAKISPDVGLRDKLPGSFPHHERRAIHHWINGCDSPKGSSTSGSDAEIDFSSEDEAVQEDLEFWEIPRRHGKPEHPSTTGDSHTMPTTRLDPEFSS